MEIYQPAEDSYLLQKILIDFLKNKNKNIKILDIGTGSGIQAITCLKLGFKNVLATDINKNAIKKLKKKIKTKSSNLFSNIKKEKFDLIIFNPPYLPESQYDIKPDTTGGKKGYEIILNFLKQSKNHLKKYGKILLLFSNYSKPNIIKKQARNLRYNYKKLSEKKLFFERLYVYEFFISA